MKSTLPLRISAWTLFAMGIAHILGHIAVLKNWSNPPDERTRALITTMNGYMLGDFPVDRNITSIYLGFSLVMAVCAMLIGALILVSARALNDDPASLRRLTRIYLGGMLVLTAVSMNYFIWPQTLFLLMSFGFAALAMARLRKA